MLKFEWDENKNKSNRKKHSVWFEEAQQVFDDPNAILYFDKDHSTNEDRYILLGLTAHISIRLPLSLVKSLKKLSLNEHYEGRYQTLIRDILMTYTEKNKAKSKVAG